MYIRPSAGGFQATTRKTFFISFVYPLKNEEPTQIRKDASGSFAVPYASFTSYIIGYYSAITNAPLDRRLDLT